MSNNKLFDTLVLDATLPQPPVFSADKMDVFADGALYFKNHGKRFAAPTTPMRFQLDEQNFQIVLSSFTINSLVEAILQTEFLHVPVNHHLIAEFFGFELTTTLLFAVIPELFYNYGHKNVSLLVQPISGTTINFSNGKKTAVVHVDALADWFVEQNNNDTKSLNVFTSLLDLDLELSIAVNETKFTNISITSLTMNGFNVTKDNLGGSVKSDEVGILYRLQGLLPVIEVAINHLLAGHAIKLPEFQVIDYTVKFDYQDGAFGTGLMVTPKASLYQ